ncbi:4'-phosphopantetheinyl transferase superfamily protein [Flavobacterium sp.]|uniref:4'-phosphopantetheinyl transferase family protein n=1 Tax=Flavobacterium sp. TaxID=239 RepID=UPI00286ABF6D|nr:4'-phosphopantetheinyl transferase superfamily protein [Flavobacterium sp.]
MIGNDIIDLALARKESNWKREGVLEKLFTSLEQESILNAANAELMFWNLWSRKEAAYKIYNRQTKIRAFIPKQLECFDLAFIDGEWLGKVIIKGNVYFTKTLITSDYIYTTAVIHCEDFDKIEVVNSDNIAKDWNGIPYHILNNNPISISHHGLYERKITLDCNVQSRL